MNDYITIIYMKYKLKWIDNKYLKYLSNIDWLAIYEKWNTTAKIVWIENIIRRYWLWHGMAWHGMAWYGMVWFGMVWYGIVWSGWYWLLGFGSIWAFLDFRQFQHHQQWSNHLRMDFMLCTQSSGLCFKAYIYIFPKENRNTNQKNEKKKRELLSLPLFYDTFVLYYYLL